MALRMKRCIGCGDTAICSTGHIHTGIGTISVGWCGDWGGCKKKHVMPNVAPHCQSINPSSCYGEYKIEDVELSEPPTQGDLITHARAQEFSRRLDVEIYGKRNSHPYPVRNKSWLERLFG